MSSWKRYALAGVVLFIIVPLLIVGITKRYGTLGGNRIANPEAQNWNASDRIDADYSNDDNWNQVVPWINISSENACRFNIKEWNENEFLGTPYSQIGSTMQLSPQVAASCVFPQESRTGIVAYLNLLLLAGGMYLLSRLCGVKKWIAVLAGVLAATAGPVAVYLFWPHVVTLAWAPLVAFLGLKLFQKYSFKNLALSVLATSCLIASGQLEIVLLSLALCTVIILSYFTKTSWKESFLSFSRYIGAVFLSFLVAAPAWLPTVLYASDTPASEERKVLTLDVYNGVRGWGKVLVLGFFDPFSYGSATPYSSAITQLPFSRMTMWMSSIALIVILVRVAVVVIDMIRSKSFSQLKGNDGRLFYLLGIYFVLAVLYGKFHHVMKLLNKLPIFGDLDENLFRLPAVLVLILAFGIAATQLTHTQWKIVLGLSAVVSFFNALGLMWLYSNAKNWGSLVNLEKVMPFLDVPGVWKAGIVVTIILCVVAVATIFLKEKFLYVGVSIIIVVSGLSVYFIRPQNFVDVSRSKIENALVSKTAENGRLIAPSTRWPTIGSWYDIESVSGYALPNHSNFDFGKLYKGCTFQAGFIFVPCEYTDDNKSVYDLSNIEWAILPDGSEDTFEGLQKTSQLANGYSLYKRSSGQSSLFVLPGSCSNYSAESIADKKYQALASDHTYDEDTESYTFTRKDLNESISTSSENCLVMSVAFHDDLAVSGVSEMHNVGNLLAVTVSREDLTTQETYEVTFENKNFVYAKVLSLLGLLTLTGIGLWGYTRSRKKVAQ